MSGNADEFRRALEEGNYDPDEGIVDDSDSDTDSSSDFGQELGTGQRTSGGDSTDTNQTDSDATQSESDDSNNGRLSEEPLNVDSGDSGSSGGSSVDSFPTPGEVNQEVAQSDTAQSEPDLTDTSTGSVSDNLDVNEQVSSISRSENNADEIAEANQQAQSQERDTVQGGSFRQAPEAVGGGQAPPEDPEAAEGGPVDAAVDRVKGPPGEVEAALGSAASTVQAESAAAAGFLNRNVVGPGAALLANALTTNVATAGAEDTENVTETDGPVSSTIETGARGAGRGAVGATVGAPAEAVALGNLAADAGEFTARQVEQDGLEEGLAESGEAAVATGQQTADQLLGAVQQNPVLVGGMLLGGGAATFGGGRALGKAIRGGKRRARTAGGTDVDATDLADEDVVEGDERFPGADEPDRVRDDPAGAVEDQAERKTPEEIQREFEQAGATEGVTLKKAIDAEPRGPERGRTAQGFEAPEADSELAGEFETSGTSVGPEASPYFFGDSGTRAGYSLRPGLPDTQTDQSTLVLVRTDVENPDARTTQEFDAELREAEGDTTAKAVRTEFEGFSPTQEAEAQLPPGAEFADVGTGPVRNTLRRLGIGADFTTEINGRQVPIRTVAPKSELDSGSVPLTGILRDDRAMVGAGSDVSRSRVVRDLSRTGRTGQPVDRPLPTGFVPGGTAEETAENTTDTTAERDTTESRTDGESRIDSDSAETDSPSGRTVRDTSDTSRTGGSTDTTDRTLPPLDGGGSAGSGGSTGGTSGVPGSGGRSGGSGPTPGSGGGGSGGSPSEPVDTGGPNRPPNVPGGGGPSVPGTSPPNEPPGQTPGVPSSQPPRRGDPDEPDRPRRPRRFGFEKEPDEDEEELGISGVRAPVLTDFLNPISGERLETSPDPGGLGPSPFGGDSSDNTPNLDDIF